MQCLGPSDSALLAACGYFFLALFVKNVARKRFYYETTALKQFPAKYCV